MRQLRSLKPRHVTSVAEGCKAADRKIGSVACQGGVKFGWRF